MGAQNKVIAGDYEGGFVNVSLFGKIEILTKLGFGKPIEISKETVSEYEVLNESNRKSASSAVGRAFVGGVILGPVGWLAGLSAKSKGIHVIAIQFKDGKKSLLDVNERIYSDIIKKLF